MPSGFRVYFLGCGGPALPDAVGRAKMLRRSAADAAIAFEVEEQYCAGISSTGWKQNKWRRVAVLEVQVLSLREVTAQVCCPGEVYKCTTVQVN